VTFLLLSTGYVSHLAFLVWQKHSTHLTTLPFFDM
jgi:hypothetical protein